MVDQLLFKPTLEEKQVLDENNIRWTAFCRDKIMKLKNKDNQDIWDKIVLRMLLIIMGSLIFALSPLLNDIILITIEYIIGTTMVVVGSLSLIFLWKSRRNNYQQNPNVKKIKNSNWRKMF